MSDSKGGRSSKPSSSPGQHHLSSNPTTPNHHQAFYPPQDLPGVTYYPYAPAAVQQQHHHHLGYAPHYYTIGGPSPTAPRPPTRRNDAAMLAGRTLQQHPYYTPSSQQSTGNTIQTSPLFSPNAASPQFSPPPPLPPLPGLAVSPNDHRQDPITNYQISPGFSEAPDLNAASGGSSESSSSFAAAGKRPEPLPTSNQQAATMKYPEPALSAFKLFANSEEASVGGDLSLIAHRWKHLSNDDREYWESMEEKEKARCAKEKKDYALNGGQPKRVRKKKDPSAPKRSLSAFLLWAKISRKDLQRQNPKMPNADISRLLGQVWRKLSPEEKRPFQEQEEKDRMIYNAEMEVWRNNKKYERAMHAINGRADKKQDAKKDDIVSFRQEESSANQGYSRDQEVTSQFVNDQSGSYAEIQASTEHYHEYHGGASSWQPPSYQEVRRVQFKYPQWRPDEDTKEA